MSIRHYVDRAGFENVLIAGTINYFDGWAVNEDRNDPVDEIQFRILESQIASMSIRKQRPDLVKLFGSSLHGFSGVVQLPEAAVGERLSLVAVTKSGISERLGDYEISRKLEDEELQFRKANNLPSDLFMHLVVHNVNPRSFLEEGRLAVELITKILRNHDIRMEGLQNILDFGVGCGRVIRWWPESGAKANLFGTDINAELVDWCRANLRVGDYRTNTLRPPSTFDDSKFDLIYALSVFTHLSVHKQIEWLEEFSRIVVPGKFLILTVHGDYHAKFLSPEVRTEYERNGYLILSEDVEGENMCAAYQSEMKCRDWFGNKFEVLGFYPKAVQSCGNQDLYLLKSKRR